MNKEELKKLIELQDKFDGECYRVCSILRDSKERIYKECGNISWASAFEIENDNVVWKGHETWAYGGEEFHSGYFPIEYLTKSDAELRAIVRMENKEYDSRRKNEEIHREELAKEMRRKQHEKLKKEFEE